MKLSKKKRVMKSAEIDLTPMIDTVMFLLIFFMLTTTLKQKENDLGINLPGRMDSAGPVDMPDEQIIEITAKGDVMLNGKVFEGKELGDLVKVLVLYRQTSDASKSKCLITIQADENTVYERIVNVMNACVGAGISNVTFGGSTGG